LNDIAHHMMPGVRTTRTCLRKAMMASALLHIVLAVAVVMVLWSRPASLPSSPRTDTGVDVVMRMFDAGPSLDARAPDLSSPAPAPSTEPPPSAPPSIASPEAARVPHAGITPHILSPETLSVISRSVAMRHVAGSSPSVSTLHAAMRPGQTVVYLLDCSGSMGEHGKLSLARSALLATLRAQPEGVRFQVIVYDGSARALFPGTACVPATPANIETASAKLLEREAMGRSNHIEALRVAARYRPDTVLLLTDSAGLDRDQLRAGLAQLEKRTYICLSRITASRIEPLIELR
jgi:von Willebrand factor type A domain